MISESDLDELAFLHRRKCREHFVRVHANDIENELDAISEHIQASRDTILQILQSHTSHLRTTEAIILSTHSFDFSKVGPLDTYRAGVSYRQYARERVNYTCSDNDWLSKFAVWKSEGFLEKLSARLDLPPSVYFTIRSIPQIFNCVFAEEDNVREFVNELVLVVRF